MSAGSLRVLLVDDEAPARDRLRRMLAPLDGIEIVGEAEDGEQALERIVELRPDLVFLDIQMPGCSGMEVVASLSAPRPRIVFCTAYDDYAVDAFELHAVDYLLKPVNRARLGKAIERVRAQTGNGSDESIDRIHSAAGAYPKRFLAKHRTRFFVVPREHVLYFAAEGGVTKLQSVEKHYWMQPTLSELEERLDPAAFVRISRAAVINLDAVREVTPQAGGQGEVEMIDGSRLEVSRRRFRALIDKLSVG